MKYIIKLVLVIGVIGLFFTYNVKDTEATLDLTKLGPTLVEELSKGLSEYQVIVTFEGEEEPSLINLELLEDLGVTKAISLSSLPMVATVLTESQIEALQNEASVRSIYLNKKMEYFNEDSRNITGVVDVRNDANMIDQNGGLPVTGEGVGVVVNDSGVDGLHADVQFGDNLVQNVAANVNLASLAPGLLPVTYLENVPSTDVLSGHGTHVAATVGGSGELSDGKYEGVAPGADLIGYGSGAAVLMLDALGGFDYALEHKDEYNIKVITNSWGSSGDFDPNDPINIASKQAFDAGITVLFAAGNEGPTENTHNPYAKAPWVISVAAGNKDGLTLADFSSRGTEGVGGTFEIDGETWEWKDEPTVTAPGVDVISARGVSPLPLLATSTDLALISPLHLPFYTTMSGTSMATPHVAGIVALMLEANPSLTPDDVKSILMQTATDMPGYESWEVGAGYVNAYYAVEAAFSH
ncbi:S8 family serine peptidase [Ornithinibacillus californiensis]|uniref:S8 family serine peptidase n=1 Tax=Ornithinibacillus californiensis TaxID=161536 RepID=UPI00064D92B9|nr:S8 family serine peptidase [Ornithinibacillus californiensis]